MSTSYSAVCSRARAPSPFLSAELPPGEPDGSDAARDAETACARGSESGRVVARVQAAAEMTAANTADSWGCWQQEKHAAKTRREWGVCCDEPDHGDAADGDADGDDDGAGDCGGDGAQDGDGGGGAQAEDSGAQHGGDGGGNGGRRLLDLGEPDADVAANMSLYFNLWGLGEQLDGLRVLAANTETDPEEDTITDDFVHGRGDLKDTLFKAVFYSMASLATTCVICELLFSYMKVRSPLARAPLPSRPALASARARRLRTTRCVRSVGFTRRKFCRKERRWCARAGADRWTCRGIPNFTMPLPL